MSHKQYDVAVLGWWYGVNYGSVLTYYGLNKGLQKLGYNVLMVNETLGYNAWRVAWADNIMPLEFAKRQNYQITEQYRKEELQKLNNLADTFLVGSDQLWNPGIPRVNEDLLLSFVDEQNARIAYGTSISRGEEYFNSRWIADLQANLAKFAGVSVRENGARDLIEKYTGLQAQKVVDPVYLLDKDDYEILANQASTKFSGKYLTLFLLDPNEAKRDVAIKIADKIGLEKIVIIPNPEADVAIYQKLFTDDRFEVLLEPKPENMLYAYANAAYIVTDSFHGTVFATVFEKPFNSFYNAVRGAARFEELMALVKLGNSRQVTEEMTEEMVQESPNVTYDIDYTAGLENLAVQKEQSKQWLKDTIDVRTAVAFDKAFVTFMTNHEFIFYREGPAPRPIAYHVTFDKYGVVSGITSPNERYWRYENRQFKIMNASNKATNVFDIATDDVDFNDDRFKIIGNYLGNTRTKHVFETREAYYSRRFAEFMPQHEFVFYRKGFEKSPIAQHVVFHADGQLTGIDGNNEKYWRYKNDCLEILDVLQRPTTTFKVLDIIFEKDKFNIEGQFLANDRVKHVFVTRDVYNISR